METSKLVFIGVKPHLVLQVLKEVHDNVSGNHVIVSIANGIKTTTFEQVYYLTKSLSRIFFLKNNNY